MSGLLLDRSGLSPAEKRAALAQLQGGRCAICEADRPWCADHDHATGLLRGLLCPACNRREGQHSSAAFAVDDPAVAAYLASPPAVALGWMWDLPDWWAPADTREVRALGITVLEYISTRNLDHLSNRQAVDALQAIDLPELGALPDLLA